MTALAYHIDEREDVFLDRYRIEPDTEPPLTAEVDASTDGQARELEAWGAEAALFSSEVVHSAAHRMTRSQMQLRKLLDLTGWSRRAAGDLLGISHTQVNRILGGVNDTRLGVLLDDAVVLAEKLDIVARALGSSVGTLLKRRGADGNCAADMLRDRGLGAAMGTALRAANPHPADGLFTAPESPF